MMTISLKGHGSIFQKGVFYINMHYPSRDLNFKFQFNRSYCLMHEEIMCIATIFYIPYCVSLIMVTMASHFFINIFQMVHLSAVKVTMGYEKNMSFVLMPKSQNPPPSPHTHKKKKQQSDWPPLNKP